MSRIHWCWVVVWALGCAPEAGDAPLAQRHDPVIYGDDNRLDVPVHPDPAWQAVGRDTVVALMSPRVLDTRDPDRVRVRAATLRDTQALCPDERFVDQPVAADCSGTLVGADRVLTAGHCVDGATCDDLRVVFGWHQTADGAFGQITADDIYRCVEVEAWSLDERGADLALIRLDRVAAGRTPATLRLEPEPLPRGTPLVLIGYPSGLPAKIDDGGQVVVPGGPTRFQATVDAFGGNSGSGVFSAQDGRLVGVLVAGQQDYVVDGRCRRVNRLPDARSPAESLIYPAVLLDLLCVDRPQHPLCMPVGEGWCQPCAMDVACPTGWTCRLLEGVPGQGACAVGCMGDGDCRADHACVAAACVPRPGPTLCQGGDVWQEDACGLARRRVERCPVDGPCRGGACTPAPPGDTCADATPLAPGRVRTDLSAYADDTRTLCGGGGPDRYFRVVVDTFSRLRAVAQGAPHSLALRLGCTVRDEAVCAGPGTALDTLVEPGEYYLVLDSEGGGVGMVTLTVTPVGLDEGVAPDQGARDMLAPDLAPPDFGPEPDLGPEPDFARPDVGPRPDAAPVPPLDAAVLVDATPTPDPGPPGPPPPPTAGSAPPDNEIEWTPRARPDCSAAPTGGAPAPGWWLALAGLTLRRRRRRP